MFLTTGVPARNRLWPWDRSRHAERVERRSGEAKRVCAKMGAEIAHFSGVPSRELKDHIGNVRDLVLSKARNHAADTIWAPAYEGGHPDHDIANFIASTLRDELPVWEFSEYNFHHSRMRSNEFFARTAKEIELRLSDEERQLKQALLAMYASERANLAHLRTQREEFRPLADYDYSRPPHPGTLFYRRFAWASFHPRVNHVRPDEVTRAIAEFQTAR